MAASTAFLLALALLSAATISAHNILEILSGYPDYSLFSSYLNQTRLADDINSRQTITVLALPNADMTSLTADRPLSVIKKVLSLHILLDYYDPQKLYSISEGTTLTTTLYQTTGEATGNIGFVNITDLKDGKIGFGSAAPGSKLDSFYTKSVMQIPYNISVLEISAPIIPPGILTAPAPTASGVNISAMLEKAGCKLFASLIAQSGVLKVFQARIDQGSGLTVFAPTDDAFAAKGLPDLSKLSNAELVSLLQYHALTEYSPKGTLKTAKDPIPTLATSGVGKFDLTTSSSGDDVLIHTGVDSARIASTLLDSPPVVIFTVSNVLLPEELFAKSPSAAPAPAPPTEAHSPPPVKAAPSPAPVKAAPSPAPVKAAPPPAPVAETPAPISSPPAPPTGTPEGAPAEAPSDDGSTSDENAGVVRVPEMVQAVWFISAAMLGLLS
ncbi:Kinesin-like protein fla10 [Dionaea muscipula]